ncbi:MAG: hypothetical protein ACLGGV_02100 [Bacteroidia bacterium]
MRKNVRVEIPRNPEKLIALAEQALKQHKALGAASPLKGLDMTKLESILKVAAENQEKALLLRKQSEDSTESRNRALGLDTGQTSNTESTVLYFIVAIKTVLLGINKGSEQKLGNFGFEVNTSPRKGGEPTDEATGS